MGVMVQPGSALVANGTVPGNYAIPVAHDTTNGEPVDIAAVSSSNRIDTVVGYIDMEMYGDTGVVNNTGALKFLAVKGTPNTSPLAPDAAAIQSAVGAGNPYFILGDVATAPSTGQITSGNITDKRIAALPHLLTSTKGLLSIDSNGNVSVAADTGYVPLNVNGIYSGSPTVRRIGSIAYLSGSIIRSSAFPNSSSNPTVLPVGYRPSVTQRFALPSYGTSNSSYLVMYITPDGFINIYANGATNQSEAFLSGVQFFVD